MLFWRLGNFVPADVRLINAVNLKVEESALTGESFSVLKDANISLKENIMAADMLNLCFSTTTITNGHGIGVVVETGMNTKVGKIANMLLSNESEQTPLQKRLAGIGKSLGIGALIICMLIFIIGICKNNSIYEMFMTSVGLAVAAIPEGLPAIVTIVLSIGVTRMAKKNAIIRRLPAVETLGSSSVICSDKTGTLTQNKMTVVGAGLLSAHDPNYKFILELGAMCTDVEGGIGDPTEVAIVNALNEIGIYKENLYKEKPRVNDIPFDSTRKLMTTIHKTDKGYRVITKGAVDVLLDKCNLYYDNGKVLTISDTIKNKINNYNTDMANNALRIIGVAFKDVVGVAAHGDPAIHMNNTEQNLIFAGLIGMIDPPREGVKEAIRDCKTAGIKTVMITGDHIATAKAIAKKLGILDNKGLAISGQELDKMSYEELQKNIYNYSVFARVSPEHKVKIVKAFKAKGEIVAMTGDGINDAPALKAADIGVAMGLTGTDVAKNASDMIITDDNFVTIVDAVKTGRGIYENIKKTLHFLISTNIGEIVAILIGIVLGIRSPLLAIQLLWVNLVTDSLPAIALGLEKVEKNIMHKKPINPKKGIFADGLWNKIIMQGIMIGILTLLGFTIGNNMFSLEVGRTFAFAVLSLSELVHAFNIRTESSVFSIGIFSNKYLVGALILGSILQIGVISIGPVAEIFKVVSLNKVQWLIVAIISISPLIVMEAQKAINNSIFVTYLSL